jgi:hypothetical protein
MNWKMILKMLMRNYQKSQKIKEGGMLSPE